MKIKNSIQSVGRSILTGAGLEVGRRIAARGIERGKEALKERKVRKRIKQAHDEWVQKIKQRKLKESKGGSLDG